MQDNQKRTINNFIFVIVDEENIKDNGINTVCILQSVKILTTYSQYYDKKCHDVETIYYK
ncbi:MAG: hypothetical protein ACRC4L_01420 [Mycoplasma sp.]